MNVLLVDDAEINLRIYRKALRNIPNVTFFDFTSSEEALAWCAGNAVDLAIVDYRMPAPDGLEFIERFRGTPANAHASVVMVTSRTENSIRYRALELGANDFLTKPIDAIELAARAANMLALADARRKLFDRAAWLSDEVRKATQNILLRERETIECLTLTAEYRDNETGMHILRIGQFSALIGRYAGLSEADVDLLLLAAPMHDIGKVATPDHILLKPGKLDAAEWEIMKQHTVAGFEILKTGNSPLLRSAADIAIGHHEKYDGTGYPFGRAGDQIPLFARICAISDVFDALASDRPYKTAWTIEKSVEYVLERAGTQFDPDLIVAFRAALPEIIEARTRYADKAHDAPAAPPVRYGT